MTNKQIVEILRSELKPYIGIMSPSYFSQMIAKINNDMCKPKTVEKFFKQFGYKGEWNNYEKLDVKFDVGYGKDYSVINGKKFQCQDYIPKPINCNNLKQ